jgi:ribose-phosphate pyrophosphokinase
MMVLAFGDGVDRAQEIARLLRCAFGQIETHRFPDGETRVTLPPLTGERVAIYRSLNDPNTKLVELLLAGHAARAMGVKHLTLIAPYLCYMRQDIAFHPGEAVSQEIVGRWLSACFDRVITIEPHLHRTPTFSQAVPAREAVALTASTLMGEFVRANARDAILIGPDEESAQWVSAIARSAGLQAAVAEKVRRGDTRVEVSLPDLEYVSRHVVLVDDILSTGGTLISAAQACLASGATCVEVLVVHALCDGEALVGLRTAGISNVWSTDTVPHATNAISVAPLIAECIAK